MLKIKNTTLISKAQKYFTGKVAIECISSVEEYYLTINVNAETYMLVKLTNVKVDGETFVSGSVDKSTLFFPTLTDTATYEEIFSADYAGCYMIDSKTPALTEDELNLVFRFFSELKGVQYSYLGALRNIKQSDSDLRIAFLATDIFSDEPEVLDVVLEKTTKGHWVVHGYSDFAAHLQLNDLTFITEDDLRIKKTLVVGKWASFGTAPILGITKHGVIDFSTLDVVEDRIELDKVVDISELKISVS